MKKKLMIVSCFAAAMLMASCAGTETSTTTSADTTSQGGASSIPDDQKITITYKSVTGKNLQPYLDNYISTFNEAYPQYKVVSEIYSGSYNQLESDTISGFAAGNYPDLVQAYPDHVADYIAKGKAVKLDDYINSTDSEIGLSAYDKTDYITNFMNEGNDYQTEGYYSVPNSKSTELMFWNKDVLNGLVLPGVNGGKALGQSYFDNLTWEELFDVFCPAIISYNDTLAADKKILKTDQAYHSIFAYDSDDNLFITLAEQYGYGYTSVDKSTGKGSADFVNDDMKGVMKTFHKAAQNGYIISKGSAGGNYTNTYFTKQNTLFSVGSTGGVKYQYDSTNPIDVGVARIPHAANKDAKVILQGPSICILDHNDSERTKGAWLFWKWMTNKSNSLNWALNSGYMGIRNSCYESSDYQTSNDETEFDTKTLDRLMARSNTYTQNILDETFTSPVFVGSSACRTAVSGVMTFALTKSNDDDATWNAALDSSFNDAYTTAQKAIA